MLHFSVRHSVMATMRIKSSLLCVCVCVCVCVDRWGVGGCRQGGQGEVSVCPHYRGYVYSATENSMFGIKEVQLLHDNYFYSHTVTYFLL
jgi:hypothetical protein